MKRDNDADEVVFLANPGDRRTILVLGACLAAAAIAIAVGYPGGPVGWAIGIPAAALSLYSTFTSAIEIFRPKPRLTVSSVGFETQNQRLIRWQQVDDLQPGAFRRLPYLLPSFTFVAVTLKDAQSWRKGLRVNERIDAWLWSRLFHVDVGVATGAIGLPSLEEALRVMEEKRQSARTDS